MRLKTLNGAPICEHLDFNESSLLDVNECTDSEPLAWNASPEDTSIAFKWRRLTTKHTRLRTGWSQPYLPGSGLHHDQPNLSFSIPNAYQSLTFTEGDTTTIDTTVDTTVTFDDLPSEVDGLLKHSLIFHDTLLSSQVLPDAEADTTISSSSFQTTSFGTTASDLSSPRGLDRRTLVLQVPPTMAIAPLGSLPSAHHLQFIYPQTPTPNLLCVLMTNPERREVFIRKGGYKMNLWEVTVADDTRPSFKVSFWIRPPRESNNEQTNAQSLILQTLERVKVGDILLLRHIALTSFRDTVYGQSLNPAITRARTSIDVLMRSNGVSVGQLPTAIVEPFTRVKRWAKIHLAADDSRKRKGSATKGDSSAKRAFPRLHDEETLPTDTMESV